MIDLSDCLELGTITKPHGIRGHVVLNLNNLHFDDIQEMETVYLIIEGLPVPFFISEYTERNADSLLLLLDDISDESLAGKLANCKVYIPSNSIRIDEASTHNFNKLIGFEVIDKTHGLLGWLNDVLEVSSNSLLKIVNGKKEILLPLNEEFVLGIDARKKKISVNIPEGLLEI